MPVLNTALAGVLVLQPEVKLMVCLELVPDTVTATLVVPNAESGLEPKIGVDKVREVEPME